MSHRCPDCKVYLEEEWTPSQGSFWYCPTCGARPKSIQHSKPSKPKKPISFPTKPTTKLQEAK